MGEGGLKAKCNPMGNLFEESFMHVLSWNGNYTNYHTFLSLFLFLLPYKVRNKYD